MDGCVAYIHAMTTLNKRAILAIILTSYVMIVLDTSIVLTGLPRIHQELGFTDTGLAWVQSAYTLAFGGFLLLAARAGDLLGRRRMLVAGLAIFTIASVAIGLAQSAWMMIAARSLQGLGAAILAPSTLALLQTTFTDGADRMKALPMVLIGAGQGMALSQLTASGISGVAPPDAGAASGVVNVAHQLGNSLGLAVLVAIAAAGTGQLQGVALLAHRVTAALTAASVLLALAFVLVWTLIVGPRSALNGMAQRVDH